MISAREVRLLMQYVNSLEESLNQLQEFYNDKNIAEVKKIKEFILDVQGKMDNLLAM